jgi:hypothetical protein
MPADRAVEDDVLPAKRAAREERLEGRLTNLDTKLTVDQAKLVALGVSPDQVSAAGNSGSTPAADQVTLGSPEAAAKAKLPSHGGTIVAKM